MRELSTEERLTRAVVKGFKKHWKKLLNGLKHGGSSRAERHNLCFEADARAKRSYLARKFYGLRHASRMATLSDAVIRKNLDYCLGGAVIYISTEYDDPKEQEKRAQELVIEEYILCESPVGGIDISKYDSDVWDDWNGWVVRRYPDSFYDDWYDNTFIADTERDFILLKSTGETFTRKEIEWLERSIISSIEYNSDGEPIFWDFSMSAERKNVMRVSIWGIDKEDYLPRIVAGIKALNKKQLVELIGEMEESFKESKSVPPPKNPDYCPFKIDRYFPEGAKPFRKLEIQRKIAALFRDEQADDLITKEIEHILDKVSKGKYNPRGKERD